MALQRQSTKGSGPPPTHFGCLRGSRGGRGDISQDGPNRRCVRVTRSPKDACLPTEAEVLRVGIRGAFQRITDVLVSHASRGSESTAPPAGRTDGWADSRLDRCASSAPRSQWEPSFCGYCGVRTERERAPRQLCPFKSCAGAEGKARARRPTSVFPVGYGLGAGRGQRRGEVRFPGERAGSRGRSGHNSRTLQPKKNIKIYIYLYIYVSFCCFQPQQQQKTGR